MKNILDKLCLGTVIMLTWSSCTVVKINTIQNNIPNLKEKGDLVINPSIGTSTGKEITGTFGNLNGGYAITDDVGIYLSTNTSLPLDYGEGRKYYLHNIELGVGMIKRLSPNYNSELIGGLGYGTSGSEVLTPIIAQNPHRYSLQHGHMFAQYNIIYEKKKFFFALSPKATFLRILEASFEGNQYALDYTHISNLSSRKSNFLVDLGAEIGFNIDAWSFYYFHRYTVDMLRIGDNYSPGNVPFQTGISSINNGFGIKYRFAKRMKI